MTIPAFVNAAAGSSDEAIAALDAVGGFSVSRVEPDELSGRVRDAATRGAERVVVAGGDGTIATAAAALRGTRTALALLPGGTLNHFARDLGIPLDQAEAARAAATAPVRTVDVACVNDRLFLNMSSVGAYVAFVRARERLERRFGYRTATALAALRLLGRIRPFHLELEVDGRVLRRRTALLFVGVGEREIRVPTLGGRVSDGRRGLHVIVAHGGTAARLGALGVEAMLRGIRNVARGPRLDAFMTDHVRIELRRAQGHVAVDGELVDMLAPLEYRIERDALRVVAPEEAR